MDFIWLILGFLLKVVCYIGLFFIVIGFVKAFWVLLTGKDNSPLPWYGWWQAMK
jgi:hypothetical protein